MILGLIGGAGSGKSAVARILENEYGYHVIQTDHIAKQIMNEDPDLKQELINAFGDKIYNTDGTLNKEAYSAIIFRDPKQKKRSDEIIHPRVWHEIRRQISSLGPDQDTVVETALPDTSFFDLCDRIICVQTDPELRIQRMMENRGYTRQHAEALIRNQHNDDWYMSKSDIVINNDGSHDDLREEITNKLC